METTLTMAYSVATDAYIVHAGASRAYLFREGEARRHHAGPEDACAHLVDLAVRGGGPDNVTAVVARYQVDQNP